MGLDAGKLAVTAVEAWSAKDGSSVGIFNGDGGSFAHAAVVDHHV
jgi:hypothetical protein